MSGKDLKPPLIVNISEERMKGATRMKDVSHIGPELWMRIEAATAQELLRFRRKGLNETIQFVLIDSFSDEALGGVCSVCNEFKRIYCKCEGETS